ncbi:aminotransferase class I/II-fold pyridoxal phosphate-dependent enzyme [uncultured Helicobacter sp.]|uniref:aminotransferase class I/II-fold pyridoxal phosphate-dependent enzyme n=1 Tax=uncultured Helicobacter sp. TaxID=175537 RepID=UPI0025D66DD1|nr:aminotransferase class I/II-fold pyridoxal phosphate-dependent enzyme [uncultured Helicobacter sp.]
MKRKARKNVGKSLGLSEFCIDYEASIFTAMSCINQNTMGVAFVVDSAMKLQGVISDGDIRRGLLRGLSLQSPVKSIMQKAYYYTLQGDVIDNAKLAEFKLIPIVDTSHILVDYYSSKKRFYPVATPSLHGNELNYLLDAFFSSWISSSGRYITQFEEAFALYCGVGQGVSVFNGTVALHLALHALGITQGDEVIVPDLTFAATINAVLLAGATPVIVDIEEDSWCISPQAIESAITPRTKAIIPVHLYGQVCDMEAIMNLAKKYKLYVIEDCAEAHGAEFDGKKVGSFGDVGCFSFFGNKVITTGEGGMCVCNDKALSEKMRILRDHGMDKHKRYWHSEVGFNYRMTNIQAALGLAQLERIDEILYHRERYEKQYKQILGSLIIPQAHLAGRKKITWLASFLFRGENKDEFMQKLKKNGIDSRNFFYPLSDMPLYAKYAKPTPVAHKISNLGFNLPTYESLRSLEDISSSIQSILKEF